MNYHLGECEIVEFLSLLFSNQLNCAAMRKFLDFGNGYPEIRKEVEKMRTNSDALIEEGREEGREEGVKLGDRWRMVTLVCKKMKKNKELEEIAEDLEEEVEALQPIYRAAERFAPEYDPKLVFDEIERGRSKEICDSTAFTYLKD